MRRQQATVATRITIAAGASEVFEYLTNLKYHYLWNPQVRKISTREPLKLGGEFKTESVVLGVSIKATNVVTGFVPNKDLIIENTLGAVKYSAHFRLQPKGAKTLLKLSTTISTDMNSFFFTKPLLKKLALRELQTDLAALKLAVEHKLE